MNAFFIAPAVSGVTLQHADLHPPVAGAAARPAGQDRRRAGQADGRRLPPPDWRRPGGVLGRSCAAAAARRPTSTTSSRCPRAAITLQTAAGFEPTGAGRSATGPPRGRRSRRPRRTCRPARRRRAARTWSAPPTASASPGWSRAGTPTTSSALVTDLHAVNTALEAQGFGLGLLCSLRGLRRAVRAAARPGLPVQAGHVLPVRAQRRQAARETSSSSRCATPSPPSCRSRTTPTGGCRCGAPPACEPAQRAGCQSRRCPAAGQVEHPLQRHLGPVLRSRRRPR